MAKRKKKPDPIMPLDGPTEAQMQNGSYDREVTIHAESGARATVHRNNSNALERWIKEGGIGFEKGAVDVIRACQFYWSRLKGPKLCASYGERLPRGVSDGVGEMEALDELRHLSRNIPVPYWRTFEMVCRFNEPAGYAGSSFASNSPQQIQSTKVIVGMVASFIAAENGY